MGRSTRRSPVTVGSASIFARVRAREACGNRLRHRGGGTRGDAPRLRSGDARDDRAGPRLQLVHVDEGREDAVDRRAHVVGNTRCADARHRAGRVDDRCELPSGERVVRHGSRSPVALSKACSLSGLSASDSVSPALIVPRMSPLARRVRCEPRALLRCRSASWPRSSILLTPRLADPDRPLRRTDQKMLGPDAKHPPASAPPRRIRPLQRRRPGGLSRRTGSSGGCR